MQWTAPEIVEIGMNAEIGGYQADFTDSETSGPRGPVLEISSGVDRDDATGCA